MAAHPHYNQHSLVPWLRRAHPGYFTIVVSLVLSHLVLGFDAFTRGRHGPPIYTYVTPDIRIYGVCHLIVAGVTILALYLHPRHWWLARAMFFLSLLTFNMFAVCLLVAVIELHQSWIAPTGLMALSLSSAATWREPIFGPSSVPNRFLDAFDDLDDAS